MLQSLTPYNLEKFMAGELSMDAYEERVSRVLHASGLLEPVRGTRTLRAMVAMDAGIAPELVSRYLDWRDFESFAAGLISAKGFRVVLDLRIKRPRAQVDILARSPLVSLIVDCKHWARDSGPGALAAAVEKQRARAVLLRTRMKEVEPMAVVILSLADVRPRFVDGAAVVPIRTLGDFLDNLAGYSENLSFC